MLLQGRWGAGTSGERENETGKEREKGTTGRRPKKEKKRGSVGLVGLGLMGLIILLGN